MQFVKEALLTCTIKLLFFFFFLNGTNQLNTVKDTMEKLLCNFGEPWNADLAVESPQGALQSCVSSGRGRRCRGTHCPSQSLGHSLGGVPMDPKHLAWTWGPQGDIQHWGGRELSSLLTAKGNVSLLHFGFSPEQVLW